MGKDVLTLRLCVIIPVYNEEGRIAPIVKGVRERGLEVLVVDDGSKDSSGAIAAGEGAVVLRNDIKRGKGRSLVRGFVYAREHNYEGVITMDGDGQHAPSDLDVFLQKICQHPESIVTGNRMHNPKGMPLVRLWTNRLMSWLISYLCCQRIPDTQCGYRYISQVVLGSLHLTTHNFEIETEVLVEASRRGFSIFSVPIQSIYCNERSKINPLSDTVRFFSYLFRVWRSRRQE
jgi:glycosyltransferase involved in cell wall biosynthesis